MQKFIIGLLLLTLISWGFLADAKTAQAKGNLKEKIFVHYPKEPGKPTPRTCNVTTNDQVPDYLLVGWHMPTEGMSYKINLSSKSKGLNNNQITTAVANAFNTWAAVDGKQIFRYGGTTSVKNPKYDGTNAILWKPLNSQAIAITYVWYWPDTGLLAEADTVYNSNYKWSYTPYRTSECGVQGTYDVQDIGTHEFGHWVGLDDLYNSIDQDLTMYGYGSTAELKKDTLGLGDILGVNSVAP